ncbi:putative F-box protein At1g67623 [Durio zibethinus]|uniref:F-box protein At1g67623 n=1 Tax=Durio zibethinus TaxID=66656 RepID=A0A6P5XKQ2_DURZI|nr:putative F-box protein At1g67623 [Durio zibethinus]
MTNTTANSVIESLPEEMLSEILRHAASNSVSDFVNLKLSCRAFFGASNYNHIFENVSMEKHRILPLYKSEQVFFKLCKDAGNPEALYKTGMCNCFNRRQTDSGLRYLKKAVEKGHVEAIYSYGIILICLGGELQKQGLQVLSSLNLTASSKRSFKIASCRSKTQKILSDMWVFFSLPGPREYSFNEAKVVGRNCEHDIPPREHNPWIIRTNIEIVENLPCCDSCFWDREATLFCTMLEEKGIPEDV